ncbi:MAG: hypothetical protein B6I20_09425 [Bacteroidetes bacterium 4572_117]|nr:MAG: hypothetical protein B6I20_09425 [Bacteroidetes bacterium 4572_117]
MFVIVYLSLIAPIEFVGKTLNIVWALQMVLLLWVAQKLDIKAFRFYSALYILVVIINTFYELYQTYNNISPQAELKTLFINIDFISGLIGSLALLFCFYLVGKEHKIYYLKPLKMSLYQAVVSIFAVIIIYFNIYIEISYHITIIYESELVHKIILGIYNFGFMLLISTPFLFIKVKKAKLIGGVLVSISILFYFFYYTLIIIQSRDELLASAGISQYQFWSHLIISALVVILAFSTYLNFRKICINHKFLSAFTIWPAIFIVLAVLSFELDHIWIFSMSENNIATADILEKVHRMPYTLLWSVFAAFLTLIGTIINYKQLRQVSLFIVFCALVKLFIDLQYMNIANKTASLIGMGGILLVIAFIYQFNSSKITNND